MTETEREFRTRQNIGPRRFDPMGKSEEHYQLTNGYFLSIDESFNFKIKVTS